MLSEAITELKASAEAHDVGRYRELVTAASFGTLTPPQTSELLHVMATCNITTQEFERDTVWLSELRTEEAAANSLSEDEKAKLGKAARAASLKIGEAEEAEEKRHQQELDRIAELRTAYLTAQYPLDNVREAAYRAERLRANLRQRILPRD